MASPVPSTVPGPQQAGSLHLLLDLMQEGITKETGTKIFVLGLCWERHPYVSVWTVR